MTTKIKSKCLFLFIFIQNLLEEHLILTILYWACALQKWAKCLIENLIFSQVSEISSLESQMNVKWRRHFVNCSSSFLQIYPILWRCGHYLHWIRSLYTCHQPVDNYFFSDYEEFKSNVTWNFLFNNTAFIAC